MSMKLQVEEIRGRNLIPRGSEEPKDMLVDNFTNTTGSLEAIQDFLDPCKMSEILKEFKGETEQFPIILSAQHKFVTELFKWYLQAEHIIQAKNEIIHDLEKELTLQREVALDPDTIKLVDNFTNTTGSLEAIQDFLDPCKMSEILKELKGETEQFPIILSAQHKCVTELFKRCHQAEHIIQAKNEIIHDLEKELTLQREVALDPDTIKLVRRPESIGSTETQTDVNMDDLDDIRVQLMRAKDEVLRLGNELVEKDEHITEYESELHSQREQAKRDMEAKDEIIQALEKELEVQREKLVRRPESIGSTETQTDVNMDDLDDICVQLMRAKYEVLRLRNELVENDEHITEYESELHSQREQAKRDMEAKDEIIQALEKELEVQREKLVRRPESIGSTETQTDVNMDDLDDICVQLMRAKDEVLRLGNELVEKDEHITEYESELHSQREQAKRDMEAKDEIIQALEKELEVQREKMPSNGPQTTLHNERHKTSLMNIQMNSLKYQVCKTDTDALKLQVERLRDLCEEAAGLGGVLYNAITERDPQTQKRDDLITVCDQLTQERDDLLLISERQVADMENMQTENEALKCEIEYLKGQCNDVATIEGGLETATAELQRLKEVRDHMRHELENLRDQCKDIIALAEQKDKLILQSKCQAGDTKSIEKARDALRLEKNDIGYQCMDAATPKEQLSIATEQHPKFRKGIIFVLCIILILFFVVLRWILRDPPINYGTHFASPYKMSSYCNLNSATTVPSHIIIV